MPYFIVAASVRPAPSEKQLGMTERMLIPPEQVFVAPEVDGATQALNALAQVVQRCHGMLEGEDFGRLVFFVKPL